MLKEILSILLVIISLIASIQNLDKYKISMLKQTGIKILKIKTHKLTTLHFQFAYFFILPLVAYLTMKIMNILFDNIECVKENGEVAIFPFLVLIVVINIFLFEYQRKYYKSYGIPRKHKQMIFWIFVFIQEIAIVLIFYINTYVYKNFLMEEIWYLIWLLIVIVYSIRVLVKGTDKVYITDRIEIFYDVSYYYPDTKIEIIKLKYNMSTDYSVIKIFGNKKNAIRLLEKCYIKKLIVYGLNDEVLKIYKNEDLDHVSMRYEIMKKIQFKSTQK